MEGGARCGRGAGLHVLVTDQAAEIAREFDCASRGNLSPTRWFAVCRKNEGACSKFVTLPNERDIESSLYMRVYKNDINLHMYDEHNN